MSDDAEYERVRRAAYSRDATEADLATLARFEAGRSREPDGPEPRDESAEHDLPPAEEQPADVPLPLPGRRRRRIAFGAVALALAVGVFVGATIAPALSGAGAETSLAVFTEQPDADDATSLFADVGGASHSLAVTDVRHLGTTNGHDLFGARGVQRQERGDSTQVVCLAVASDLSDALLAAACAPVDRFALAGVTVAFTPGVGLAPEYYQWGPVGTPFMTLRQPRTD
ncbi:hypothetical protein BH11ACT3_BH11ACT3_20040 [soil metagenome]